MSGALGNLGTFLPHIIGAITVVGMDPTGILVTFGMSYALSGAFYGIPIAVQPMKAASGGGADLAMDPGSVAGAGLVIGAFFAVLGASGMIGRIARALPPTVAAGLQLGLGLSLAALAIHLVEDRAWLGGAVCGLMLVLMRFPRVPMALIAVFAGGVFGAVTGITSTPRHLALGLYLPHLIWPDLGAGRKRVGAGGPAANPANADERRPRDRRRVTAAVPGLASTTLARRSK